jgi:4-alpha-glucanotransferase
VLKARYNGVCYLEWPVELVRRTPAALAQARRELANQIELVRFAEFLLSRQAERLEEHAHDKGVQLIGDLPFFVSPDSSDVWAHPELFLLGKDHHPTMVAGVPPRLFQRGRAALGQPRLRLRRSSPERIYLAWESAAALAIAPVQDLLNLGNEARMKVRGRLAGNWRWRCTEEMLANRAFEWLRDLTSMSGRSQGTLLPSPAA